MRPVPCVSYNSLTIVLIYVWLHMILWNHCCNQKSKGPKIAPHFPRTCPLWWDAKVEVLWSLHATQGFSLSGGLGEGNPTLAM